MSIFGRVVNHFFYNGLGTQSQGAKLGSEACKRLGLENSAAEFGAVCVGAFLGSALGGLKLISPVAIIETIVLTDESLEKRVEEMGPWGGFE